MLGATGVAQNPPAPPEGWTSRIQGSAIVLTAPGSEVDRPALMFLPPEHPQGDTKE